MLPQDPNILLSLVNTKLRDGCTDLESLRSELGAAEAELEKTLKELGYAYDGASNQFKPE